MVGELRVNRHCFACTEGETEQLRQAADELAGGDISRAMRLMLRHFMATVKELKQSKNEAEFAQWIGRLNMKED